MARTFKGCFSMCHCEYVEITLESEEMIGLTEEKIFQLAERKLWKQIRQECTDFDAEDLIEMEEDCYFK